MSVLNSLTFIGKSNLYGQDPLASKTPLEHWAGTDKNRIKAVRQIFAFDADPIRFANTLDLSGLGLTELPPGIECLTDLQFLNLRDNRITELPSQIGSLHHLRCLWLQNNSLRQLPNEIGDLRRLEFINLSKNPLEDLPENLDVITDLKIIIDTSFLLLIGEKEHPAGFLFLPSKYKGSQKEMGLMIRDCVRALPNDVTVSSDASIIFAPLVRLQRDQRKAVIDDFLMGDLDLTDAADIGEKLWKISLHVWASLDPNKAEAVDRIFAFNHNPSRFQYTLDLSDLHLTELPPGIECLRNLQSLNASGNMLSDLPNEIGRLTDLRMLNLSSNQLTQLPLGFASLTNLTWLSIEDNQLRRIPDYIGDFQKLEHVYLGTNEIIELPSQIGCLKKLKYLRLIENPLEGLPPSLSQIRNLEIAVDIDVLFMIADTLNPAVFLFVPVESDWSLEEIGVIIMEADPLLDWEYINSSEASMIFGALSHLNNADRRDVIDACLVYINESTTDLDPIDIAQKLRMLAIEQRVRIVQQDPRYRWAVIPPKQITSSRTRCSRI